MWNETRREALLRLLDDESPCVREALLAECRENEEAIAFLREVTGRRGDAAATHARQLLAALGLDDPRGDFLRFIDSFHYELETGCYLLERTVHPHLEWATVARFLDGVAARCCEFLDPEAPLFEKCKHLNLVLFHEYGFRGDLEHFHDPENNFLGSVIQRRRGIPISLSVLYLLVAERCHFRLEPIGAPGRFLLAHLDDRDPFYLDPFDRGRFRTEEEVRQMLLSRDVEDGSCYLLPAPVGEVLCRFCRNLVHQYTMQGQRDRADLFRGFICAFENAYERESS